MSDAAGGVSCGLRRGDSSCVIDGLSIGAFCNWSGVVSIVCYEHVYGREQQIKVDIVRQISVHWDDPTTAVIGLL